MDTLRTALVTGGTGFLGHAVVRRLKADGWRVMAVVRRRDKTLDVEQLIADLTDRDALFAACGEASIDVIIHLAAAIPGAGRSDAELSMNSAMTANLIELAEAKQARHFIMASSVSLYGMGPGDEDAEPQPGSAYAEGKLADERLLQATQTRTGMSCCALRIAAPYGTRPTVPTVVNKFLQQAAKGAPITLFGSGQREQHFVHESDVADAFGLAANRHASGVFNVSGPAPVSMSALAEACASVFPIRSEIVHVGTDPQESYRGHFPWAKAHAAFGYEPRMSLIDGLKQTAMEMGLS